MTNFDFLTPQNQGFGVTLVDKFPRGSNVHQRFFGNSEGPVPPNFRVDRQLLQLFLFFFLFFNLCSSRWGTELKKQTVVSGVQEGKIGRVRVSPGSLPSRGSFSTRLTYNFFLLFTRRIDTEGIPNYKRKWRCIPNFERKCFKQGSVSNKFCKFMNRQMNVCLRRKRHSENT
jgi:hypothetical protein